MPPDHRSGKKHTTTQSGGSSVRCFSLDFNFGIDATASIRQRWERWKLLWGIRIPIVDVTEWIQGKEVLWSPIRKIGYCTRMASPQDEIEALRSQVAALTARVYDLEQKSGVAYATQPQATPAGQPTPPTAPIATPGFPAAPFPERLRTSVRKSPLSASGTTHEDTNLEKKIGQYWLNRIGIVAMLIGVSYFLKYAFDNNWVGPGGRIAIGLLVGIGLVLWSERFRKRSYAAFSYSLKAVGIGTVYLSLWGAFQIYHLIPAAAAFVAMAIVTAATITLALSQDAELLASFALVGGFSTPVLLSTGQNHEAVLFSYVALLDLAILTTAIFKPWRRLLWGSFAGTIILYLGWYSEYYSRDQRTLTVAFAALFAAIFAVIPLAATGPQSTRVLGHSTTLTLLPLFNAAAFFLALYVMYEQDKTTLTWYALVLAAIYLGLGGAIKSRLSSEDANFMNLLHVAIAVAFITIAIPLKLDAQWITIGWLVESGMLLWLSVTARADFLRYFAVVALTLGIARLLFYDQIRAETLVFNMRFATYAVAIGILGGIAVLGKRHASEAEKIFLDAAVVGVNLLALIALTLEASDYFDRQVYAARNLVSAYPQLKLARDFSYSAIWLVYGAILMTIGFRRRSAFVRWQSLILIAFTICKVFLYDVSQLGGSYRIVSFIALGAVLLGISFIYQRDWLGLSAHAPKESNQGTP